MELSPGSVASVFFSTSCDFGILSAIRRSSASSVEDLERRTTCSAPAESDLASVQHETLHPFKRKLGTELLDELNKATALSRGNLDLFLVKICISRTQITHVANRSEWLEELRKLGLSDIVV